MMIAKFMIVLLVFLPVSWNSTVVYDDFILPEEVLASWTPRNFCSILKNATNVDEKCLHALQYACMDNKTEKSCELHSYDLSFFYMLYFKHSLTL